MKNFIKSFLVVLVIFLGLFFHLLSNQVGGWRGFVVQSASMEPTIMTGSLVLTQTTHPSQLQEGDIITFIKPDKGREFITHRISESTHEETLSTFKTKGDNNSNEDNWVLAGGGVVGKVAYTIPYMGYALSFSQSKIGIVLLILIPALWIIYDEIGNMLAALRRKKPAEAATSETQALLVLTLFGYISLLGIAPTHALLSDTATLTDNQYTVVLLPTPTVTPTPDDGGDSCGGDVNVVISGNGAGSNNNVNVENNCSTTVTQTNETTIVNNVSSSSNTGNNSASQNTSSSSITTGNAVSQVTIINQQSTNTFTKTGNATLTTEQVTEDPIETKTPEPTKTPTPTDVPEVSPPVEEEEAITQ